MTMRLYLPADSRNQHLQSNIREMWAGERVKGSRVATRWRVKTYWRCLAKDDRSALDGTGPFGCDGHSRRVRYDRCESGMMDWAQGSSWDDCNRELTLQKRRHGSVGCCVWQRGASGDGWAPSLRPSAWVFPPACVLGQGEVPGSGSGPAHQAWPRTGKSSSWLVRLSGKKKHPQAVEDGSDSAAACAMAQQQGSVSAW